MLQFRSFPVCSLVVLSWECSHAHRSLKSGDVTAFSEQGVALQHHGDPMTLTPASKKGASVSSQIHPVWEWTGFPSPRWRAGASLVNDFSCKISACLPRSAMLPGVARLLLCLRPNARSRHGEGRHSALPYN